jgi:hypothetical protein
VFVLQVSFGVSCRTINATSTDTWQTIAAKHKVLVNELIRSNPSIKGKVAKDNRIFIPPCNKGLLQGTKVKPGRLRLMRIRHDLPLAKAAAGATPLQVDDDILPSISTPSRSAEAN